MTPLLRNQGQLVGEDMVEAYCSLVYTDSYVPGALVLAHALKKIDKGHARARVLLVTPSVTQAARARLAAEWNLHETQPLSQPESLAELSILGRPDLAAAPSKLEVWRLTEFSQIVYLDADTLPLQPLDALWESLPGPEWIGAAPDAGWPDIFNSGVFSAVPSFDIYNSLLSRISTTPSFDGSDQGILNEYFAMHWHRIPFVYNVTTSAFGYEYAPAAKRFARDIRLLHFAGDVKPWNDTKGSTALLWRKLWTRVQAESQNSQEESKLQLQEESKTVIPPRHDWWDATTHAPFKATRPEGEELPAIIDADIAMEPHVFPLYGPTATQLPFEAKQRQPERRFEDQY